MTPALPISASAMVLLAFCATACDRSGAAGGADKDQTAAGKAATATQTQGAAPSLDSELAELAKATPVDACTTLTPLKLKAVFPDLTFEVNQKIAPRMSGYVWDSRCVYWAGVGTIEFAKTTPTHTVDLFVLTAASEAKAKQNLARRHETARGVTTYAPQPTLGENAYSTTATGLATLFFVRGQSEIQINVSDLKSPNAEKIQRALDLAKSL